MRYYLIVALSFFSLACTNNSSNTMTDASKENNGHVTGKIATKNYTECLKTLRELIAGSSIATKIPPDFNFFIDDSTSSTYIIKISNTNEMKDEVAIAWLKIDFPANKLYDITTNPDNPVLVDVDKEKFQEIKKCLGKTR